MNVPRHDLEAQVRTLGADSLLPPERKSKPGRDDVAQKPTPRNEAYASFMIKKRGLFYRPYWSGYTRSELAAGRYTYAQATAEVAIEPDNISMHTAPECKPQGIAAALLRLLDEC